MAVKKKNSVRVDFTDVESKVTLPEGEYIIAVDSCVLEEGDKGEYLKWEMIVQDGKYEGKKVYNNTSLTKQSLWATKRFLECLGVEVPNGQMDIDFDEVKGLKCGIVISHETYNGRAQARVIDVFPFEDEAGSTDDEKQSEDERPTDDQIDEMGKADLRDLVEKYSLEVELEGTTGAQRRAVKKALSAAAPAKKKEEEKAPAKKPKKVTYKADDISSMSTEELGELNEKHDLNVDFDEVTVLRKQRAAISDALEEAGLLEE